MFGVLKAVMFIFIIICGAMVVYMGVYEHVVQTVVWAMLFLASMFMYLHTLTIETLQSVGDRVKYLTDWLQEEGEDDEDG